MQIAANWMNGGIISFDIDEVEAEMDEEDGESHQIHLYRCLSDHEIAMIDFLNGEDCGYVEDGDCNQWLDCGALSLQCRAYLSALRA